MRVADYMMAFIAKELQVDTVFMVSGGGIMHLTDALACHPTLHYVCSHNEQATTMEADGYAKEREGFGVALVTTGPGATNAITGVVGAWQDSTRLLVISGQSKCQQTIHLSGLPGLRQFGVQEADILPMISSVTKYSAMIDNPLTVRFHLEKARYLASSGRPGPVWLDVPLDVQGALIEPEQLVGFDPVSSETETSIHSTAVSYAAQEIHALIKNAERPLLVAGHGVRIAGAVTELRQVVEQLNLPVVTPRLGIDLIESDHPLFVGRPGIKGDRAANFAVQNSDLLLCVGARLSINMTGHEYPKFARTAKRVVVDIDSIEHSKPTIAIDRFIHADAKHFLKSLATLPGALPMTHQSWIERCQGWKKRYPVILPEYSRGVPINTYYLIGRLSALLEDSDRIVIDSGSSSYVVSQAISIKRGQRYHASGGLGSMGYAVPAALGVSVASGGGRVIAITGDGSFHMNLQELQTISHLKLPVKIVIFNNHGYASIKTTQHNFFNDRFIGVDHLSGVAIPEPVKIAALYDIPAVRIEQTCEIDAKLAQALESDGPVIIDVVCSPDQLIIPTVYSKKLDDGRMVSLPLEDMYPFLDRHTFLDEMIVPPLPESLDN